MKHNKVSPASSVDESTSEDNALPRATYSLADVEPWGHWNLDGETIRYVPLDLPGLSARVIEKFLVESASKSLGANFELISNSRDESLYATPDNKHRLQITLVSGQLRFWGSNIRDASSAITTDATDDEPTLEERVAHLENSGTTK